MEGQVTLEPEEIAQIRNRDQLFGIARMTMLSAPYFTAVLNEPSV
jgi:hypothetical protein